jgi:hypothetical protein
MVVKYPDGKKQTISYPKYLVEMYLGRYLGDKETVDHIDGDFTNNDISNLRVIERGLHCSQDAFRNKSEIHTCVWCKKEFEVSGKSLHLRNRKQASGFCSKSCSGKYGKSVQNGSNRINSTMSIKREKYKTKSALGEIPNVESLKFGEACKMVIPSEALSNQRTCRDLTGDI